MVSVGHFFFLRNPEGHCESDAITLCEQPLKLYMLPTKINNLFKQCLGVLGLLEMEDFVAAILTQNSLKGLSNELKKLSNGPSLHLSPDYVFYVNLCFSCAACSLPFL